MDPTGTACPDRPRRFWQGVVLVCALLGTASIAMIVVGRVPPGPASLAVGALDLLALVALAGYAWRRPLRHAGLQLLVFLLAAADFLRAALVLVVIWPNLVPWRGDSHAWQALAVAAAVPMLVVVAIGLYRYATDRSHAA